MTKTKIKLCGMTRLEDIRPALDSEADIVLLDSGMGSGEPASP